MKEGYFTITRVTCDGCLTQVPLPPNFSRSVEDVWRTAENVHASTGLVCPRPMIGVTYVPALVSDELAEQVDAALEAAQEAAKTQRSNGLIVPATTGGPH